MSATERGLPGLRGAEHIGFTVPDLEQATDFFVNVIGCEAVYDLGPFAAADEGRSGRPCLPFASEIRVGAFA